MILMARNFSNGLTDLPLVSLLNMFWCIVFHMVFVADSCRLVTPIFNWIRLHCSSLYRLYIHWISLWLNYAMDAPHGTSQELRIGRLFMDTNVNSRHFHSFRRSEISSFILEKKLRINNPKIDDTEIRYGTVNSDHNKIASWISKRVKFF